MKITQNSFDKILKKNFLFENKPKIAVAVSGGPDSMALLFLLNKWIKKKEGSLVALIIDHQMRKESNIESFIIKKYLLKNKIDSKIIKINKNKLIKKTMNEARQNRYKKLLRFCQKYFIFHLFVAHHYDDNLETFLLRKIAGSNLEGLGSMQKKINNKYTRILRPMLFFSKNDILIYLKKNNIFFITDPSNKNLKYTRVLVRNFLLNKKILKKQIEKDYNKIQKLIPFYKKMIFSIFHKLIIRNSKKYIVIDSFYFFNYQIEIQTKIIEIIYKFLQPDKGFVRYQKLANLVTILKSKNIISSNLGGVAVKKDDYLITFSI